jgi:hypothetical protein
MNYAMPPRRDPRSLDVKAIVYADHPRQVGNLTTASRARREDVQDVVATALCQDTVATVGQRERELDSQFNLNARICVLEPRKARQLGPIRRLCSSEVLYARDTDLKIPYQAILEGINPAVDGNLLPAVPGIP